ncbi:MAG: acid phosphatase [Deltaproteobacteria bacterium HGW-Deltaproteobacteria-6]|nr:MAG: acid phosphatase [Deltaproteobacteria bacterium HGW-Deltaproteobacteria-6]
MAVYLIVMAGCACLTSSPIPATVEEIRPGILQGYLPTDKAPNSLMLLPAPPAEGSAAFAADQDAFATTRSLINTPRWTQAIKDAHLNFPEAPQAFSCALNAPITRDAMPNLYMLMHRSWTDAIVATLAAKNHYKRIRPFVVNKQASCTPDWDEKMSKDGSYPSGHTSIGWTWALILAEIDPDRADAVLSRGYAFGQSRVVCGVHWPSDVTAGRIIGAAVVAKLHSDPAFRAQMDATKKELATARAQGQKPAMDCKAEAAALAF